MAISDIIFSLIMISIISHIWQRQFFYLSQFHITSYFQYNNEFWIKMFRYNEFTIFDMDTWHSNDYPTFSICNKKKYCNIQNRQFVCDLNFKLYYVWDIMLQWSNEKMRKTTYIFSQRRPNFLWYSVKCKKIFFLQFFWPKIDLGGLPNKKANCKNAKNKLREN